MYALYVVFRGGYTCSCVLVSPGLPEDPVSGDRIGRCEMWQVLTGDETHME
jgi:hypothetical protein